MRMAKSYQTEQEIERQALQALRDSLGVVGLIRFMQQYDKGHGNSIRTAGRHGKVACITVSASG